MINMVLATHFLLTERLQNMKKRGLQTQDKEYNSPDPMFKIKAKNIVTTKFATQTFRDNKGLTFDLLLLSDAEMKSFIQ